MPQDRPLRCRICSSAMRNASSIAITTSILARPLRQQRFQSLNERVIAETSFAFFLQTRIELADHSGCDERDAQLARVFKNQVHVFLLQVDHESWLPVIVEHLRRAFREHPAAAGS